jgi:hypothetical protein
MLRYVPCSLPPVVYQIELIVSDSVLGHQPVEIADRKKFCSAHL